MVLKCLMFLMFFEVFNVFMVFNIFNVFKVFKVFMAFKILGFRAQIPRPSTLNWAHSARPPWSLSSQYLSSTFTEGLYTGAELTLNPKP